MMIWLLKMLKLSCAFLWVVALISCGSQSSNEEPDEPEGSDLASLIGKIPSLTRSEIVSFGSTGIGSPYVWGGNRWDPENRTWEGADCSGYIGKIWSIPEKTSPRQKPTGRYTTREFYNDRSLWKEIRLADIKSGDALVMRNGDSGHIVLFAETTSEGNYLIMEAKGRQYGIVKGKKKTLPKGYIAIRRDLLSEETVSEESTINTNTDTSTESSTTVNTSTETPTNTATETVENSLKIVTVNTESGLNLRAGPSSNQPIIKAVSEGQKFVSFSNQGNWYNVWVDGKSGWISKGVSGSYLKIESQGRSKIAKVNLTQVNVRDEYEDVVATVFKDQFYVINNLSDVDEDQVAIFLSDSIGYLLKTEINIKSY